MEHPVGIVSLGAGTEDLNSEELDCDLDYGDQAFEAILRNELVAETLVSFLSMDDMLTCCETSPAFCAFIRCTKAFGERAMLTISNSVVEEGTFLKDTEHPWKSLCISEPLWPSAYNCVDNILESVTTLRLQLTREQANNISKKDMEEFFSHVIGQCQNLKSLQLEPIFLEYYMFSLRNKFSNHAVKEVLRGLKEFQIISEFRGNGFKGVDDKKCRPFAQNILQLTGLHPLSLKSLKIGKFISLNLYYRHYDFDREVRIVNMDEYQVFGRTLLELITSTSSNLVDLQLSQWQFWENPDPLLLELRCPKLKRLVLELSTTRLRGINSLRAFLPNQPPLKELSIEFGGRVMKIWEDEKTRLKILHLLKIRGGSGPLTRSHEDFLLKLLSLGDFHMLEELHFKIEEIWENEFMSVYCCPNLKRLDLLATTAGAENVRIFLKNQPPLEELSVEIVSESHGTSWLKLYDEKETKLKVLHLYAKKFKKEYSPDDIFFVSLEFLASLENTTPTDFTFILVELRITITSYWEINLMKNFQCPNLKRLELKSTPQGKNNVCSFLQCSPPLEELSIKFINIFDVKVLRIIEQRGANLKKLHLTAKYFRETGSDVLVLWGFLSNLKNLEDFSITRPFVKPGPADLRVLNRRISSKPLIRRTLGGTGVTFLRALPTSLKKLKLRGIKLFWTDTARGPNDPKVEQDEKLALWGGFNSLTHLSVTRCDPSALDKELFQIIQKNNPGLKELEFSHVSQPFFGKGSLDSLKDLSAISIKSYSSCKYNKTGILEAVALPLLRSFEFVPDRPLSREEVMQLAFQNPKLESICVPLISPFQVDIKDLKKVNKKIQKFEKLKCKGRRYKLPWKIDQDSDSDADSDPSNPQ